MNTEKKRKQIIGSMQKCFEQLGMPNLRHESAIVLPNAEGENAGHLVCSGLRFRYEEDYYSRATIDMVIHDDIPADKVDPLRKLLNLINMDLACDHFCIVPEINSLVFRTGLYVPGDKLPRNKFKKLLRQFFVDYVRHLPPIEKLLVEGGNPDEIVQSPDADRSVAADEKSRHGRTDYEKLRQGIKRVFDQLGLPVKEETITDSSVCVRSRFRDETCRFELAAFAYDSGQLNLQIFSPDALPENMISEAIDLADMFNSKSYVNHIFILPRYNYVSLLTGVILDPDLDEDELEYQLKILHAEGRQYLRMFLGNQSANASRKEQLKAILDGCDIAKS